MEPPVVITIGPAKLCITRVEGGITLHAFNHANSHWHDQPVLLRDTQHNSHYPDDLSMAWDNFIAAVKGIRPPHRLDTRLLAKLSPTGIGAAFRQASDEGTAFLHIEHLPHGYLLRTDSLETAGQFGPDGGIVLEPGKIKSRAYAALERVLKLLNSETYRKKTALMQKQARGE